jgi:hypothetical protein
VVYPSRKVAQELGVDTTGPQVRLVEIDGTITIRVPRYSAKEYNVQDVPPLCSGIKDEEINLILKEQKKCITAVGAIEITV